jgi:signal transduction histidine kinase
VNGIGGRVVVSSGLLMLVVGAAFAVLLFTVADLEASERRVQHSQGVLATSNQFERLLVDLETGQRGFVITGQASFLDPWFAARAAIPEKARALEQLVADSPVQQQRARRISQEAASFLTDYSIPLVDAARRDPASARTIAATAEGKRRMDAMRSEFDALVATEHNVALRLREQSDELARRAFIAAAVGLVISVLLILALTGDFTRAIVRPVRGTAAMAKRMATGDLSVRVPESGVGEIRELERTFNAMAGSLETGRAELAASRARIVQSADETRRRIERDLHDGIQQRLVSLVLHLRAIQARQAFEPSELRAELERVVGGLEGALEDLREISRGIHPAILSEGGLGPALRTVARRCAIPVDVDGTVRSRLPPPIEVAAYYFVSEALTNAAKHAHASSAQVSVRQCHDRLHLSVRDDGVGGADSAQGTGLIGLSDRIHALGGTITIRSPKGKGTALDADLPASPT